VKIDTAEVERLTRSGKTLIWNYPTDDDPDSGWLLEVYDDRNRLIDFAVADDPTDALLTIIENLCRRPIRSRLSSFSAVYRFSS
jgi:hypothetical protein